MSLWLIGGDLDFGQGLCLGPFLGAEKFGGRVLRFGVLSYGVACHAQFPGDITQGQALLSGLLHRFPAGLLGRSRCAVQLVT